MPTYSKILNDDPKRLNACSFGKSVIDNQYLHLAMNKLGMVASEHYYTIYSLLGNYFIGTTPVINLANNYACIVAIKNPPNSSNNIHLAAITLYADLNRTIAFYFDATHNLVEQTSNFITNVNRTSTIQPVATIAYGSGTSLSLTGALSFYRVTGRGYTEKIEIDGKIILGPGNNLLLSITPDNSSGKLIVGWGWYEVSI